MKVMLDECITRKCAHVIIEFWKLHSPPVEAQFLVDFLGAQGALDCDWCELLTPPSDWIVISSDCGKSGPRIHAKGPPLHLILPKIGITGFFLGGKTLTQATGAERARAIISKVPEIMRAAQSAAAGERFKIKRVGGGIAVEPWPTSQD